MPSNLYMQTSPEEESATFQQAGPTLKDDADIYFSSTQPENETTASTQVPIASSSPKSTFSRNPKFVVVLHGLCVVVLLLILITWLAKLGDGGDTSDLFGPSSFAGFVIGGRFSQGVAKLIDVICSAILAPFVMVALNILFFTTARTSVLNEGLGWDPYQVRQQRPAVPFQTVIAASGLKSGTYDIWTFGDLLRGRTWRLFLLVVLAIMSAIGGTALSNIVAYKAYSVLMPSVSGYRLQLLKDQAVDNLNGAIFGDFTKLTDIQSKWNFDTSQTASVIQQMTAMLTGLNLQSAVPGQTSSFDLDGGYIGTNVTKASMDGLDSSIVSVFNVPGFRLSANCTPALLDKAGLPLTIDGTQTQYAPKIQGAWSSRVRRDAQTYQYQFVGTVNDVYPGIKAAYPRVFPLLSFLLLGHDVVISYIYTANMSSVPQSRQEWWMNATLWGDVQAVVVNASYLFSSSANFEESVAYLPVTCWSLQCSITRQDGTLNFTRQLGGQGWTVSGSAFRDEKTPIISRLAQWQALFDYRPPQMSTPGLAGGLAALSFSVSNYFDPLLPNATHLANFVNNFVYASGETIRIMYNVAATNTSGASNHSDYFVTVPGAEYQQFYHITYVPILVLIAMLALIIAAIITTVLVIYVVRASGGWRRDIKRVDVRRLIVDSSTGVLGEELKMVGEANLSNEQQRKWARSTYITYGPVPDHGTGLSDTRLVIEKAPRPRKRYFGWQW